MPDASSDIVSVRIKEYYLSATVGNKHMKILVYHIGSLGDTLVAVPALWTVRENFPDAHITMLTDEQPGQSLVQSQDVLDGSGLIDDYIVYSVGSLLAIARLLLILRLRRFDTLIYLIRREGDRQIQRDSVFFKLAGIKLRIGMAEFGSRSTYVIRDPMPEVPRVADSLLDRLRVVGLTPPPAGQGRVDINIGERERANVERWLSGLPDDGGSRWLAIGPGSNMPCKIWPLERYLEVAKRLIDEYDLWPVVFGGAKDKDLGHRLLLEFGRGYVAAGVLGVRDSMAAMQRCLMFIGNDTGTMHMAAASGVRCVAVFTSRQEPGLWYPYGDGHVVLRTLVSCEGCLREECVEHKMKCILSISVEQVLQACRMVLDEQIGTTTCDLERF